MGKQHSLKKTFLAAAAVSLALSGSGLAARPAFAQNGGVTLTIDSCDDSNYPQITCLVTPLDQSGLPLQNLTASSFAVQDGNASATELALVQQDNETKASNFMLVVDFGTSSRKADALTALKQSATQILNSLGAGDQVGLIGVTGKIELGDTSNPPIDPGKESGFVNAGQDRNAIINIVTDLNPSPGTPLYDAVCKALILASKQTVGARAVIVLSDGKDAKSTTCSPDDPINRAKDSRIPVFAIGIGNSLDDAYLRRLTLQTNGIYFPANDAFAVAARFTEIQKLLKTQYKLTFKAVTPADNKPEGYPLTIRANVPAGEASKTTTFRALFPIKPILNSVVFKQGESEFPNPAEDPLPYGEVELTPNISARNIARVEYLVDGEIVKVVEAAPFAFTLDTTGLAPDREHVLIVRAYGEMTNPANITEGKYTVKVLPQPTAAPSVNGTPAAPAANATKAPTAKGTVAPTATPKPKTFADTVSENPLAAVLLPIIALATLALIAFAVVYRRRQQQAALIAAAANEPQTIMELGDAGPDVSNQTKVFSTGGLSGMTDNKTKVFRPGKASIEFSDGPMKDKKFQVGVPGIETVLVGRDVDVITGNIKVESEFVSRRHAKVTLEDNKLYLYDLGSASGTRVNGVSLSGRIELRDGDMIEFADTPAVVKMTSAIPTAGRPNA